MPVPCRRRKSKDKQGIGKKVECQTNSRQHDAGCEIWLWNAISGVPVLLEKGKIGVKDSPNILEALILRTVRAGMSRRLVIGAISAASKGAIFAQDRRVECWTTVRSMNTCIVSEKPVI